MFRASLCPKHVETEVNNKHLIVESCWFFYLHTLLTMHGHRNLKYPGIRHSVLYVSTLFANTPINAKKHVLPLRYERDNILATALLFGPSLLIFMFYICNYNNLLLEVNVIKLFFCKAGQKSNLTNQKFLICIRGGSHKIRTSITDYPGWSHLRDFRSL